MAYSCAATGTQYLRTTPASLFSYPFTINCWFNLTTTGAQRNLVLLENPTDSHRMGVLVSVANAVVLVATDGGGTTQTIHNTTISASTWYMVTGVFTSTTSRTVYVNAVNPSTGTVSRNPTTPTRVLLGAQFVNPTTTSNLNGSICEVAIWNAALTATDISSLYKSPRATSVVPQNLEIYYPLVREVHTLCGTHTVNTDGGTKGADHYRRYG